MLENLLRVLLKWARKEHVPMHKGALQAAEADLARRYSNNGVGLLGLAIKEFFKSVEVPMLVLCGECRPSFGVIRYMCG
jgi:hypothetical protein